MITLKRILRYLFYTIKENRGKMIMILCTIALLYPIFNCNTDLKEDVKVITSFKYDVNNCYVTYSKSDNNFNVLKFDKEQPISPDGYLTKDKDNVWFILSWIGFVVLCIILLIATFSFFVIALKSINNTKMASSLNLLYKCNEQNIKAALNYLNTLLTENRIVLRSAIDSRF
jgi:hypothetical protein